MRAKRKIILLVALGAGAGLLSFLISQYFAGRTYSEQRLLTQIQSLALRVDHLRLLSKEFVQNRDERQWVEIKNNLKLLNVDIATGSHASRKWQKEIQELKIHLSSYRRLLNRVHEPAVRLNGEKSNRQRLNDDLITTGDLLLRASESLTARIVSAILSTDRLNQRLSWGLLAMILSGIGIVGALLARDIIHFVKELQESRETLKESQESLRLTQFIFDKAPIGIWRMGADGEVLDVNEQGCDSLGYSKEELCRMTVFDFDPNFDTEVWASNRDALEKLGTTIIESRHRRRSGEIFPIEVIQNLVRFEDQTFHVAFVQDITERKRAEAALREKDQLLYDMGRLVKIGGWRFDLETGKPTTTDEVARICDFELVQDVSAKNVLGCFHGVYRERIEYAYKELIEQGTPYDLELEIISAKGIRKWVRTIGYPVMQDGCIVHVQGSFQDITERKRTEAALREKNRLLLDIGKLVKIGGWKLDPETGIVTTTEGVARICDFETVQDMRIEEGFAFYQGVHREKIEHAINEALGKGTPYDLELELISAKGIRKWVRAIGHPVMRDGRVVHVQGSLQDITDRKRMEDALKESEQRLELALSGANEGIWDWRIDEDTLYLDSRYYTMAGYRPDEFPAVFEEILKRIHKDDLERVRSVNERYLAGELEAFEVEFRFLRQDGSYMWIQAKGMVVAWDDAGNPARFIGTNADITERKQAEEKLREHEQLISNILESMTEGLFVLDNDFRYKVFNSALAKMVKKTKEEAIGQIPWEVFPFLKGTPVEENMKKTMAGELTRNLEIQLHLTSEETAWFRDSFSPLKDQGGRIVGVVGVVSDITQQKQDEDELRRLIHQLKESESRFKALHNASFGGITIHDKGRIIECNQGLSEITGYSVDELIGMDGLLLIAEQSRELVMDKIVSGYEKPYEAFGLRKNGEEFPLRLEARNIPYKGKQVRTVEFRDISEQKKAEEALRHLKNYLSNIIDSMPSVLVGVDRDGRVTQWNRQAAQVTGISVDDAQSRPLVDVFPRLMGQMDNIKAAIRERRVLRDLKVPTERQHETRYEDVTIFPLITNGVEGAVIRVDDVTGQVRLEEMMIQSEKMLSVGGLAAGMAHEVNNPLAGILQNASVLKNRLLGDLPANHQAAEAAGTTLSAVQQYLTLRKLPVMIDNISQSGSRAAAIVRNMLSFARKSDRRVSSHDLGTLLDQTLELVRTDYDMKKRYDVKQIRVEREYEPSAPPVPCEAGKIQQVFMNILKNGAEAMAEVADTTVPPSFVLRVKDDGAWVRAEIEDNGPGMDEKIRRRIFEPFFTTKSVGKGTGLGLSVSYFIITEDHSGQMGVHAAEGGGTCFVIRLPKGGR